jgi:hypothetical protein
VCLMISRQSAGWPLARVLVCYLGAGLAVWWLLLPFCFCRGCCRAVCWCVRCHVACQVGRRSICGLVRRSPVFAQGAKPPRREAERGGFPLPGVGASRLSKSGLSACVEIAQRTLTDTNSLAVVIRRSVRRIRPGLYRTRWTQVGKGAYFLDHLAQENRKTTTRYGGALTKSTRCGSLSLEFEIRQ